MAERHKKRADTQKSNKPDNEMVEVVLRQMKMAVPEIEKRVMEREALVAESRFEAPKTADFAIRKEDS